MRLLAEGVVKGLEEQIRMLALEDERRPDLERVCRAAGRANEHRPLTHALDDLLRRRTIGLGRAGVNDFDADGQADAAHLTNEW